MKTINGVKCTASEYTYSAIALVGGEAVKYEGSTTTRNAVAVKRAVAKTAGCKPSQVIVEFELVKQTFIIGCSAAELKELCEREGLTITE